MKNKISKKAKELIKDFEVDCEQVMYAEEVGSNPEYLKIKGKDKIKSYNALSSYIVELESRLKEYSRVVTAMFTS